MELDLFNIPKDSVMHTLAENVTLSRIVQRKCLVNRKVTATAALRKTTSDLFMQRV